MSMDIAAAMEYNRLVLKDSISTTITQKRLKILISTTITQKRLKILMRADQVRRPETNDSAG